MRYVCTSEPVVSARISAFRQRGFSDPPLYGAWPELDAAFVVLTELRNRFFALFCSANNELILRTRAGTKTGLPRIKMAESFWAFG
jgi:hypothetical protein